MQNNIFHIFETLKKRLPISKTILIHYWIIIFISALSYIILSLSFRTFNLGAIPLFYTIFLCIICALFFGRFASLKLEFKQINIYLIAAINIIILTNLTKIYSANSGFYLPQDVKDILDLGILDKDISMHLSIAESIKENLYPSTMINGSPHLSYHNGSHYLLALIAFLTSIEPIYIFPFQNTYFAVIFLTYFLLLNSTNNRGLATLVAGIIFLTANYNERFFTVFDISTPIALFWGFLLLLRNFKVKSKKNDFLLDCLVLFFSLYSKISVGVYIVSLFVLMQIFSDHKIYSKVIRVIICFFIFSFAFWLVSDPHTRNANLTWEFNSLYNQLLEQEKREASLFIFFILPISLLIISVLLRDSVIVIYSLNIILITFLAININFENRNHMHFVIASNWVSLFLFSGIHIVDSKVNEILKKSSIFIISICLLMSLRLLIDKSKRVIDLADKISRKTDASLYIDKLIRLRQNKDKFLIHIPESEKDFWLHYQYGSRYFMPFWIPMLSSKPALNGYNPSFMKNSKVAWYPPGSYGYNTYYNFELNFLDYDYVLQLKKINDTLIEEKYKIIPQFQKVN